ncbi:hypothetical protein ACH5RR_010872 [Cinchona calisaya]|uniref:Agenet domain-containing protein n=1 Tax=Cinchona calisaya TaxID=153742 RepID=A0ABD3AK54_9GENT
MKSKKIAAVVQQQQQQHHFLSKGSLVEVSSDEEGFKGAWYLATLLQPPPHSSSPTPRSATRNNNKAFVQYHTLVAEEGSSLPLTEYVDPQFVRPLPPVSSSPDSFDLGDVVDAYYRDGWWTGVVTGILQDALTFVVTFQNPPDELLFPLSHLRFHHQWVNRKWVRPAKLRAAGLMFSVGKRVEVSFDREYWRDTWFPATILEDIGNGSFLLEYHNPDKKSEAGLLKETVDLRHIRPCPPHLKDKYYVLLEKVDAFYDFGWSTGVITKALADCRYLVFFKHTNREAEFSHTDLRPHMEWKDGKWFTSSQDILNKLDYQKPEGHVYHNFNGTEVRVPFGNPESNSEKKANSSRKDPCNEEPRRVDSLPQETTHDVPSVCEDKEMLKEEIPAVLLSLTAYQPTTDITGTMGKTKLCDLASRSAESVGNNISKQQLAGDRSSENHTWGKRVKRKRIKNSEEDDNPSPGSGKSSGSSRKLLVRSPPNSVESREVNAVGHAASGVQEECMTLETNLPIILGLECDKNSNLSTRKPCEPSGKELLKHTDNPAGLVDNEILSIKDGNQLDSEEKIQKRSRGRPRKVVNKSYVASTSEEPRKDVITDKLLVNDSITIEKDSLQDVEIKSAIMDSSVSGQECVINGSGKKFIGNQEKQKNKTGSTAILSALRKPSEEVVEVSVKQQERHSSKRGRRRTVNLNSVSQFQDSPHASVGKEAESICMTKELEKGIEELPANTFEDQPLSKWIQEMHSPTTNDASRVSPARNVEQCAVASNEQPEIVKESPADAKLKIVGTGLQNLPFVKNTLLWSMIESMEVFQKLPQKPHFRPLEHCKESSREGLAIGCMVTFSSVVERTSRMQFGDPKSTIDDILETLLELESHGFDVQIVRHRITDLITTKDKQKKLQGQVEQIHAEINKHSLEKTKIDEDVDEMKKQIKCLQEKLSQAISMKETKDGEIASLQSKLEGIKEVIKSVQCDFEGLSSLL